MGTERGRRVRPLLFHRHGVRQRAGTQARPWQGSDFAKLGGFINAMSDKLLLLGFFIAIGGAASLAFGYAAHRRDLALKRWPTTTGTLVSSEIIRTTQARLRTPAHDRLPRPEPDYKVVDVWALDVAYLYTVEG